MRFSLFTLIALLCAATAYAWTKDDHEIFDLVAALESAEGKGVNFYSHLGIEKSASTAEISKAYRRKSVQLHPDKNPGVPDIQARFARLGVIAQILRDPVKRERYNFFYKNGVPKWKGLGYAYSRWRPGLGFVFSFLTIITTLLHYVVLRMNYNKDSRRVDYFTTAARRAARGANGRRKVKIPMIEGYQGGETLELVVDGENVYLPHDDGSITPLEELAHKPTLSSTWPFTLSKSIYRRLAGSKPEHAYVQEEAADEKTAEEVEGYAVDSSAPPARPRGGRAAQLRAERLAGNGGKTSNGAAKSGTSSPADTDSEAGTTSAAGDTDTTKAKRKPGAGKASAAHRRKMALKK